MSREVLGGLEPGTPDEGSSGQDRPLSVVPGQRPATATLVTELDEPALKTRTGTAPPEAAQASTEVADVTPLTDEPRTADPPTTERSVRTGWWRTRWAAVAAAAAGALVATVITGGILERRYTEERMSAVSLVADFSGSPTMPVEADQLVNANMMVLNSGPVSVEVVEAAFPDGSGGTTIGLRSSAVIPAGGAVRVPVQLRLNCNSSPPERLELTVRTPDGRTRTTEPRDTASMVGGSLVGDFWHWVCSQSPGPAIDIWTTTARDDGSLALQLRNPNDTTHVVEFRGPTGTRIVTDPPSPITLDERSGDYVRLTVQVERCTSAAQRASAAEDLAMVVDGNNTGFPPADPWLLAGWFARAVALQCG